MLATMQKSILDSGMRNYLRRPPIGSVLYLPGLDYGNWHTGQIRDYSGLGNHGTITGATWTRTDQGLWYLDYDGVDDVTAFGSDTSLDDIFSVGSTFMVWIKADSDGEANTGIILEKLLYTIVHVENEVAGSMGLRLFQEMIGVDGKWDTTSTPITVGKWTFVAIMYNSSNQDNDPTFVIDNSVLTVGSGITEAQTPTTGYLTDAAGTLNIGNRTAGTTTFDGGIALPRVLKGVIKSSSYCVDVYQRERILFGV